MRPSSGDMWRCFMRCPIAIFVDPIGRQFEYVEDSNVLRRRLQRPTSKTPTSYVEDSNVMNIAAHIQYTSSKTPTQIAKNSYPQIRWNCAAPTFSTCTKTLRESHHAEKSFAEKIYDQVDLSKASWFSATLFSAWCNDVFGADFFDLH